MSSTNDINTDSISLYEYLDSASEIDKRKVLYFTSKRIKEIHNNGGFIPYLNPKTIRISNNQVNNISFINVHNGKGDPDFEKYKNLNVYEFAMLAFNAYLPGYNISKNGLLNYDVIRDNFDNFSYIFDNNDINYFREVIVNNNFTYYSDYIDELDKNKSGNNMGDKKSLSYYTKEGKLLTDNEAAFTSYLLLSVYVAVVLLIIFVIYIYIS